jgi:hypothetical protein
MEQQGESKVGGFLKGAIGFAIVAAIGVALVGAGPIVWGALFGATKTAITGAAILGGVKTAFASYGLLAVGGAAVAGGGLRVVGGIMRDRQESQQFEAEMQRAQAMDGPKLGRDRSQQPDFEAMGNAAGINYGTNWTAQTGRGQGAGQSAGIAQPTPRI